LDIDEDAEAGEEDVEDAVAIDDDEKEEGDGEDSNKE
jgi:hypothetical protein